MCFSAASLRAVLEAHVPAGATGLVVALSGGVDSTGLLAAAASLGNSFRGLSLRAVHVDHGLQAAAGEFREACAASCARLNVPLRVVSAAVHVCAGESIEAAARDARYAALQAELRPGECLMTAHHAKDQAETLLLQALRGAGLKGMSAMPVCRTFGGGWHLRPALDSSRSELLAAGAEANCAAVADPMNDDLRFDRSYLRRQVWPLLEKRWPGADGVLARAARHAADAQRLLDRTAAADVARLRDGDGLSVQGLRALCPEARMNAVRYWLHAANVEPPGTSRLTEALRQVLDAEGDQLPAIAWGGHALRRYRQRLCLTEAQPPRLVGTHPWSTLAECRLELGNNLGELRWAPQAGGLDAARLPGTLNVRRRAGGESLRAAARAKTMSLQHLCQSYGVLPWMRDALPLVFAGGALIAVADLWADASWCKPPGEQGIAVVWERAPIIV